MINVVKNERVWTTGVGCGVAGVNDHDVVVDVGSERRGGGGGGGR